MLPESAIVEAIMGFAAVSHTPADYRHNRAVVVSTEIPPEIPGTGFSFAPYIAANAADMLITAQEALAIAQQTGINADAWTQGSAPIATLVKYTNTINRTAVDVTAWVITSTGVPIAVVGPHGHKPPAIALAGLAEWIIDATTGTFLGAADQGH